MQMLYCVSHWTRDAPTTTTRGQSCAKPTMLGINAISQRNALPQSLINYANSFESTFRLDYHYLSASQRHFINSRTSAKSLASLACERLCSCARHNPHPAARPLPPAPPLHVDPRDPMKAKVRSRQVHASSANFGCEFSHQRRHQLPTPAPNTPIPRAFRTRAELFAEMRQCVQCFYVCTVGINIRTHERPSCSIPMDAPSARRRASAWQNVQINNAAQREQSGASMDARTPSQSTRAECAQNAGENFRTPAPAGTRFAANYWVFV